MRCERGYTTQLPDLVGWARPSAPVALIAESGGRREDRQKLILEAWARGGLVRPLHGRAIRLRERIRRPLDRSAGEEDRATAPAFHSGHRQPQNRSRPSPPPTPKSGPSTRASPPPTWFGRSANRTTRHPCPRRLPQQHLNRIFRRQFRRQCPRPPKLPPSATGDTARYSASTTRSQDANGTAEAEQLCGSAMRSCRQGAAKPTGAARLLPPRKQPTQGSRD
jgi:hypothetical protein